MNVRAHIYKPLLSGNAISAQLVWQQLPKPIIPTTYDIRIYTADSSMEMISLCVCVWVSACVCVCLCECVSVSITVCVFTCL